MLNLEDLKNYIENVFNVAHCCIMTGNGKNDKIISIYWYNPNKLRKQCLTKILSFEALERIDTKDFFYIISREFIESLI